MTDQLRQAAQQALDAWDDPLKDLRDLCVAMDALRTAPEQQAEPVAWMFEDDEDNGHKTFRQTPPSPEAVAYLVKWNRPAWVPLYTTPPQRKPLSDEEIGRAWSVVNGEHNASASVKRRITRAIEAAHCIKEGT